MRSKRAASAIVLALLLSASVACNAVQTATDALLALSTGAIALNQTNGANGQPILSTADTGVVLTYATQALSILQAQPSGWKATVQAGWAAALVDIATNHPNAGAKLTAAIAVVTAAIAAL
jgi:hypothetical protein